VSRSRFWFMTLALLAGPIWPVWGQSAVWQPPGATSGSIYYNGGNVGIGTAAPVSRLDLKGGNLRISRTADANGYVFQNADNGERLNVGYMTSSDSSWLGAPILTMLYTGNVGIGTTAPQYKLAVNGTIGAKDVIVTNTGWPDYVFRPGYRLRPLREVGEFIAANRHLPDMPPAAEVEARGVSVGEMQAKLLAKIEELTLHLIRQEKESEELRERLRKLEKLAAER